jgi:hypothetical protein
LNEIFKFGKNSETIHISLSQININQNFQLKKEDYSIKKIWLNLNEQKNGNYLSQEYLEILVDALDKTKLKQSLKEIEIQNIQGMSEENVQAIFLFKGFELGKSQEEILELKKRAIAFKPQLFLWEENVHLITPILKLSIDWANEKNLKVMQSTKYLQFPNYKLLSIKNIDKLSESNYEDVQLFLENSTPNQLEVFSINSLDKQLDIKKFIKSLNIPLNATNKEAKISGFTLNNESIKQIFLFAKDWETIHISFSIIDIDENFQLENKNYSIKKFILNYNANKNGDDLNQKQIKILVGALSKTKLKQSLEEIKIQNIPGMSEENIQTMFLFKGFELGKSQEEILELKKKAIVSAPHLFLWEETKNLLPPDNKLFIDWTNENILKFMNSNNLLQLPNYKLLSIKNIDKLSESNYEDVQLFLQNSTPNQLEEFSIESSDKQFEINKFIKFMDVPLKATKNEVRISGFGIQHKDLTKIFKFAKDWETINIWSNQIDIDNNIEFENENYFVKTFEFHSNTQKNGEELTPKHFAILGNAMQKTTLEDSWLAYLIENIKEILQGNASTIVTI